jgi:flagellar basal-body rod modification protein FlgD
MTIPGIDTGNRFPAQVTAQTGEVMGKEDFLKLLIAQLQHQDPLNPMDGTEFTVQLAQFTSLEQLNNVNGNLETLQNYQASINNAQAVSFIGKTVRALGDGVRVGSQGPGNFHVELTDSADVLMVNLYDPLGNFVRAVEYGPLDAGRYSLAWDGRDHFGRVVPEGDYRFEALATGSEGQAVKTRSYVVSTVRGIRFQDGATVFDLDGGSISMSDLVEITE